jgi:hypothetical protein
MSLREYEMNILAMGFSGDLHSYGEAGLIEALFILEARCCSVNLD